MKKILFATFILAGMDAFSQSRNETSIRKLLSDQTLAWNRGDIEGFMQGYWQNDSLKFIGKNGITYGWTNALKNYKKNYPDTAAMGKLDFTLLEIKKLSGKYFFVIGKWHLQRSIGDIGGHFTLLFHKINRQWKIIADHTS
jgi:ketosteroid isomerase-like protein